MQMRLKLLTATLSLVLFTTNIHGQCSVHNEALGKGFSCLYTEWEQLPVKSHDGIFANFYFVRLLLVYKESTTNAISYTLQLKYGRNISGDLFPRRLYFQFYNYPGLQLDASDEEAVDDQSKLYIYPLSEEEIKTLREHALLSIEISDYRTNTQTSCKPYTFLFTEIMACLKRQLEKEY